MSVTAEEARDLQQQRASPGASARGEAYVSQNSARANLRWWVILLIVWSIAGIYAGSHLMRGWVPHDEGAFSESAERVLSGQLPHRDYVETYTGGLAYLHAFAFRHLGENFATLRIVLFVFFLAWIPAFYWIASRLVSDWAAGGVTLLAIAWSLPNYSAAVPSWYNLFFATFGMAALFRYLENRSRKWLFVAGLCGGLSILAKIPGLYYVAGVLLFFVFSEQKFSEIGGTERPRKGLYSWFVIFSALGLAGVLALLVSNRESVEVDLNFVVPGAALVAVVLWREMRLGSRGDRERFAELLQMCVPFVLGILAALLPFLLLYRTSEALHALATGLFVLPFKRFQFAFLNPPPIATIVPSLCLIGVLGLGASVRGAARWVVSLVAGALTAFCIISSGRTLGEAGALQSIQSYRAAFHVAYWLTPCVVLLGAFVLWQGKRSDPALADSIGQQKLFLILSVLSLCSLVQYPYAHPIYFCYVAPLVILGAVGVLRLFPVVPRPLLAIVFIGLLLFAVLRVNPSFLNAMGSYYRPDQQNHILDLPRAGNLKVEAESVDTYKRLIPFIQQHADKNGIYATPDCPEVYFLAGYENPTSVSFQLFESDDGRGEYTLGLLDRGKIRVVVLNHFPIFSPPVSLELHTALVNQFPNEQQIGRFEVRWRD
jgi:hypothetical protein